MLWLCVKLNKLLLKFVALVQDKDILLSSFIYK